MTRGAAFFDLDRTLIRKSSALALAGAFRRRGLIDRRAVAKAAAWQAVFALRGLSAEGTSRAVEGGVALLRDFGVTEMRELVAESMDRSLKPLVYPTALELVAAHRRRGERSYVVSAALQEIVEAIAQELGLDGAIGSIGEVIDGRYTGRCLRACHGPGKAAAVVDFAAANGIDLGASAAYSDGYSDLPLLEAVGRPVAVNPDRDLRKLALVRGWEILDFRRRRLPVAVGAA
jgi:HAD superfamily hydrolase (TIGR01490 family)